MGVRQGDRVGVMGYNRLEWLLVQLASALGDYVLVNINPAYLRYELAFCLKKVGVAALFLDGEYHRHNYVKLVRETIPSLPSK
jgi:acyl-CoA synthetase (AMP-forming)/AMP-acid ligase II